MSRVIISGWQEGFHKISMTKLIRTYTGYGLAEGKGYVDDLLEGKTIVLKELADEQAERFVAQARELRAVCHIDTSATIVAVGN